MQQQFSLPRDSRSPCANCGLYFNVSALVYLYFLTFVESLVQKSAFIFNNNIQQIFKCNRVCLLVLSPFSLENSSQVQIVVNVINCGIYVQEEEDYE